MGVIFGGPILELMKQPNAVFLLFQWMLERKIKSFKRFAMDLMVYDLELEQPRDSWHQPTDASHFYQDSKYMFLFFPKKSSI